MPACATRNASDALDRALAGLISQQHADGAWEGEMVWSTMILSQYVMVHHIVRRTWDEETRKEIARHYAATRLADGSWGSHPVSAGSVFNTTLAYVALRLLGLGTDDPLVEPARRWLHAQPGGALAIPTWGKFWLALLGLYEYAGIHPCPPELYLLPKWLPFHPRQLYCHTRLIYLAMAYLYGSRFRASEQPPIEELRKELYEVPYENIDFVAHRHSVSATDLAARPHFLYRLTTRVLSLYELLPIAPLRRRALAHLAKRVLFEQRWTRYQALSPVNGLLNCLVLLASDSQHPDLEPSLAGLEAWKWEDEAEGIRYAGARAQSWDTSFAVQAILAAPHGATAVAPLRSAYRFLSGAQLTEEVPDFQREGRDPALGGWCFSDGRHRWPVSDCTAEALSALLSLLDVSGLGIDADERVSDERLRQAARFILQRQNRDGGFGTYERRRGGRLLELFNPSEMFLHCMTEGSYVECTAAALTALCHFRSVYPGVLQPEVDRAVERGVRFLRSAQRADGSFEGFWGIYFIYGTFHALRGLRAAGVPANDLALVRGARWLTSVQKSDGGWGEHHSSCLTCRYVEHPDSQAVMTSWAVLALLEVLGPEVEPVLRGVRWLRERQLPDGSWESRAVAGVFFGTAMLDYRLYRWYFPTWALARHATMMCGTRRNCCRWATCSTPMRCTLWPGRTSARRRRRCSRTSLPTWPGATPDTSRPGRTGCLTWRAAPSAS